MVPPRSPAVKRRQNLAFRPRARLLVLLGDQLIRDAGIAAFELVKNGYDADASEITVTMSGADQEEGCIVFQDDGEGMDWPTVTEVWLEPGTDNRSAQRASGKRSARFKRLPLGEKGVGRFAAHKLGRTIELVTRKLGQSEIVVQIDWEDFEAERYLEDVKVSVRERDPVTFLGKTNGTRIEITDLRTRWNRRMVRDLQRAITSIQSPFEHDETFRARLILLPDKSWLGDLLSVDEALDLALFRARCVMEGDELRYEYEFRPLPGMTRVQGRGESRTLRMPVDLSKAVEKPEDEDGEPEVQPLDIGRVRVDLYVFDREPAVLALGVSDKQGLLRFLNENGGVRVYRDGIRVYDYGERGNDWLDLGGRRVNHPTARISNNLVLGAVSLDLVESADLVEKTNREGFVENLAYETFRRAVLFALQQIEAERNVDKERIRKAYQKGRSREPVLQELTGLRRQLKRRDLDGDLGPYVDRIESQFIDVRDRLLTAAGAGLSLSVVVHEVEKGVAELNRAVQRDTDLDRVRELARHLAELIEGLAYLTRRGGATKEPASILIRQAIFNTDYRARYHNVEMVDGVATERSADVTLTCTRRLIVATLMNLVDNSIYWLDVAQPTHKRIYLGTSDDFEGPALVVADNGTGFADSPEYLIQPFMTRRPDGMGLGLHIADEVMKAHRGRLAFPEPSEISLPRGFRGAVIALVFPKR